MRHVADHGHRLVVVLARQRDDARADGGDQLVQAREVLGGRVGVGTEDPVRALEQVGSRAFDAVHLRAGHGMPGHEVLGMRQDALGQSRDARLRGGGVRDDAAIVPPREVFEVALRRADGRGEHHEVAAVADEAFERRIVRQRAVRGPAALDGFGQRAFVDVDSQHPRVGIRRAHSGGERGAHQSETYHRYTAKHLIRLRCMLVCHETGAPF